MEIGKGIDKFILPFIQKINSYNGEIDGDIVEYVFHELLLMYNFHSEMEEFPKEILEKDRDGYKKELEMLMAIKIFETFMFNLAEKWNEGDLNRFFIKLTQLSKDKGWNFLDFQYKILSLLNMQSGEGGDIKSIKNPIIDPLIFKNKMEGIDYN